MRRERRQADAARVALRRELADHGTQRVGRGECVVAVGDKHEPPPAAQASADEPQQVERGVIGPVHVLDDEHGERALGTRCTEAIEHGVEQNVTRRARAAQPVELLAESRGEVEEGPERPRRREAVAGTPRPAGVIQTPLQRLDERRLADACLARDEHHPAVAGARVSRVLLQGGKLRLALEELHGGYVSKRAGSMATNGRGLGQFLHPPTVQA
ncbi:MAG TPA: hypothetical protein VJ644_06610 [Jiangellaceae bacterium]|nr:hypothetical protein [Jiangellaceae bacterium]